MSGPGENGLTGRRGEDIAADYLQRLGWSVVDRNWRCDIGELDLVCLEPVPGRRPLGVAVEVKTRRGRRFGDPLEAITAAKLARLHRLATQWARNHRSVISGLRLDAVGVLNLPGRAPELRHVRGI